MTASHTDIGWSSPDSITLFGRSLAAHGRGGYRIRAERWVQHAAADRVLGYLQEALEQPLRERMENILLIGEGGMGKTMLVRKFERQNAAPFDDDSGVQRKRQNCAVFSRNGRAASRWISARHSSGRRLPQSGTGMKRSI